jgi:2-iminobutanoate/2-iminopropanoate deaminase
MKMKNAINLPRQLILLITLVILFCTTQSCKEAHREVSGATLQTEIPEYFLLRPGVEKLYGYSHAVKIGDDLKISGAVSMDSAGNLIAAGNLDQQMKNCYSDLEKILQHYGYTFDDVVVENVYTTNMTEFIKCSSYRNSIYKKQFPTGTWLEVKGLALQGQLIEIDMEAHKTK